MAHEMLMGDDGILRVAFIGDMGEKDVKVFIEDFTPFLEAATEAEPLIILADASRSGKTSSAARKAYVRLNRDPRGGKVAVVGSRRYDRVLVSFILKATGRGNIRFFNSYEEALAWLKAES